MKPFLLIAADFIKTGGMDRANYALAEYLAKQGTEVHLVSHQVDPDLASFTNVCCHIVPRLAKSDFLGGFLIDWVGQLWARRITRRGGRVLVNGGNCRWTDINWVHYVHAAYVPESKVGLLQQIKAAIAYLYFRYTEQQNLKHVSVIITNSKRTNSDLIDHKLANSARVHAIYYGIDSSTFYPASFEESRSLRQRLNLPLDRPIVVFIGALGDRRKGFDLLFEAWRHLCQAPAWNAHLLVIGQGAELPIWKQRLARVGLLDRVQFLGFRSDVPDLLRASDCLVAPTRYEAYGLGVHEALCCGIPAIVSATAGVAERYPNALKPLLLPDINAVDQLVNALCDWQDNRIRYQQIVQTEVSEQLRGETWDQMAQQMLQVIEPPANSTLKPFRAEYSIRV